MPSRITPADAERVWTIVVAGGSGAAVRSAEAVRADRRRADDRSLGRHRAASQRRAWSSSCRGRCRARARRSRRRSRGRRRTRRAAHRCAPVSPPCRRRRRSCACTTRRVRSRRTDLFERSSPRSLAGADGAVPGVPVTDTIKVVDATAWSIATPTARRWSPCRHRRRSAPTAAAGRTRSRRRRHRRRGAGRGRRRAGRRGRGRGGQPQDHPPGRSRLGAGLARQRR